MKKTLRLIAICGLAFTLTSTVAWAASAKLSQELQSLPSTGNSEVIVQYKIIPTPAAFLSATTTGAVVLNTLPHIKGAHMSVPNSSLQTLAADPNVKYISPNRQLKAAFDQITDGTVGSTYANSIGQTGAGIGVAIIDSGVANLPDFYTGGTSRIVYQQSFVGTEGGADPGGNSPADEFGHGTHVAGILAGNGNGTVYAGVVPQANIINLRVLDINGAGTDDLVIQAIETAISLKNQYNIKVINLSLGRGVTESYTLDPLCQAV